MTLGYGLIMNMGLESRVSDLSRELGESGLRIIGWIPKLKYAYLPYFENYEKQISYTDY